MKFILLACLALGTVPSGTAQQQSLKTHFEPYHLQRSDVLDLKYRYTPEFDQTITIAPDGQVQVLGFGAIQAGGLTLEQFRAKLMDLSSARLNHPDISVLLKEFDKPHVLVEGEVNQPGRVELRGETSALDAVALAGGFKPSSKPSAVLLLRRDGSGAAHTRVINLKQILSSRRLEEAPMLEAGDRLYVLQGNFNKIERLVHLGQFGAIYNPIP